MSLLNNVFGGTSDNILRDLRKVIMDTPVESDFPIDKVNAEIAKSGRIARFDDNAIDRFLSISCGRQLAFLSLTLLYDENTWGLKKFHKDHIFPKSAFTEKRLREHGISEDKIPLYLGSYDRIGNLQLLNDKENEGKSDKSFEDWITTRDSSFKGKHLIPEDTNLYKFKHFNKFFDARENLIIARLKSIFKIDEKKEAEHT